MGPGHEGSPSEVFLAALAPAAAGEIRKMLALDALLESLVSRGQAAWPTLELDEEIFLRWVAERVAMASDPYGALLKSHVEDLYLACACARGDERAIREFELRFMPEVAISLKRIEGSAALTQEVAQKLRESLFVAQPGVASKIADYRGIGALDRWIRVAALRMALNLAASDRKHVPLGEEVALGRLAPNDFELEYIKREYRDEFREAFLAALGGLSDKERYLLRLQLVHDLSLDEIGSIYGVNRSTVSRWIGRAREAVLADTRRSLAERLRLTRSDVDSLMRLMHSQLDGSIQTFLGRAAD